MTFSAEKLRIFNQSEGDGVPRPTLWSYEFTSASMTDLSSDGNQDLSAAEAFIPGLDGETYSFYIPVTNEIVPDLPGPTIGFRGTRQVILRAGFDFAAPGVLWTAGGYYINPDFAGLVSGDGIRPAESYPFEGPYKAFPDNWHYSGQIENSLSVRTFDNSTPRKIISKITSYWSHYASLGSTNLCVYLLPLSGNNTGIPKVIINDTTFETDYSTRSTQYFKNETIVDFDDDSDETVYYRVVIVHTAIASGYQFVLNDFYMTAAGQFDYQVLVEKLWADTLEPVESLDDLL